MLRDEDTARAALEHIDRNAKPPPPSFAGFTPEIAMLTLLANLMQQQIATTIGTAFGSTGAPRVQPIPLPRSRLDELLDELEMNEIDDLAARAGLD